MPPKLSYAQMAQRGKGKEAEEISKEGERPPSESGEAPAATPLKEVNRSPVRGDAHPRERPQHEHQRPWEQKHRGNGRPGNNYKDFYGDKTNGGRGGGNDRFRDRRRDFRDYDRNAKSKALH